MIIMTVIGARPQFVKAAVVSAALATTGRVREVLVHTGQHYDANMSDIFFQELGIPEPDFNLNVGSGSHGFQTGQMLIEIEKVCQNVRPDLMLVYGDTNSTIAGALAAAKLHIPVAHVEAGLRSFNMAMPEEINRILTDRISNILFAPTATAVRNLEREGFAASSIVATGDVMLDAARHFAAEAARRSDILKKLSLERTPFILATVHRASNVDNADTLGTIFSALAEISDVHPVIVPLHPRTRDRLRGSFPASLKLIDPVGFLDMNRLESQAKLIVTDSGGVQKEAFFHGVPCVTLREDTEWHELVEHGFNRLTRPANRESIISACRDALSSSPDFEKSRGLFGEGDSAASIARHLVEWLDRKTHANPARRGLLNPVLIRL